MVFSLLLSLLREFEGTLVGPDGVDAHGAPAFAVNVVKGDCGAFVESLLLGVRLPFGASSEGTRSGQVVPRAWRVEPSFLMN